MIEIKTDKSIGDVVFIIEGDKTEVNLLYYIFTNIFNYKFVSKVRNGKKKTNIKKFIGKDKSCIVVVNTSSTHIKDILNIDADGKVVIEDFSDQLIYDLAVEYEININKSAVFYLFDRDPLLNTDVEKIKQTMQILRNPYQNENDLEGGLFLISYPSFESFLTSNLEEKCYNNVFYLGNNLKQYNVEQKYMFNKVTTATLIKATENFLGYLKCESIEFDNDSDLDDFSNVNINILDNQEQYCKVNKKYRLVSLVVVAFLNLGIIEIK